MSPTGIPYHSSLEDLKVSAEAGCELCTVISSKESFRSNSNPSFSTPTRFLGDKYPKTQIFCTVTSCHQFNGISTLIFWQPKLPRVPGYFHASLDCYVTECKKSILSMPI